MVICTTGIDPGAKSVTIMLQEVATLTSLVAQRPGRGSTRREILRLAKELDTNLIVIGSHGREGIQRLLGSTANAVLHGAPCDVLAVRIKDK
jgi:nucleotide-binding universal stress UspA family protein